MTQSAHAYAYLRPSAILDGTDGRSFDLATSGGATPLGAAANPRFFAGFLADPAPAAAALLAVADVAAARYYQPRLRASLDPVVTANGDRLRFESFSGCCGVYARLDVLQAGLDGDEIGHGTTNVDVNNPLREALTRIGPADPLHLAVGPDALEVTGFDGPLVEKKVPLPERRLRGFAETQVVAAGFGLRAELPAVEAVRFLRSLPRGGRGTVGWVVPAGRALRPTTRPVPGVFAPGRGSKRGHVYMDRWWEDVQRIAVAQPGIGAGPEGPDGERLAPEFQGLLDGTEPSVSRARKVHDWAWRPIPHWIAMLPRHREELAARWLDHFAMGADRDERGAGRYLLLLAESGGPAGLALHLAVAYGLGARHAEDRTGAVDALLVLAARGDLDGALLGRELGELMARGTVTPTRLVAALGLAAETGAGGTVWVGSGGEGGPGAAGRARGVSGRRGRVGAHG
ncbi:DUF6493 family protein [Kitasatospora sp. NPDC018058]|uniref:DUF6493 family protein n=1 Tax=Kitasatospora sp. NPDC018058 TaxID=3364025 RepID=UPI0037C02F25